MTIVSVTDQNFDEEVLKAKGLVLVDFWAEWCGPCKMIAPVLEELAKDFGKSVKIVKVNVDESPETPTKYGVRSIPTLMLFKDGESIDTKVGVTPKPTLEEWINSRK